jgi:hypothetical protein
MEKPYPGRAIINNTFNGLEIIIPSKKSWLVTIFLFGWLGGWSMGEYFALSELIKPIEKLDPGRLFIAFWLVAWTVGGFFAFSVFIWNLIGKEVILFTSNQIEVKKIGTLFYRPKIFSLAEAKHFRAVDMHYDSTERGRRNNQGPFDSTGTIHFDYGLQTVQIASGIGVAEAEMIFEKLTQRGIKLNR